MQVDSQDQSEVWSAFRVGRRARVRVESWREGESLVGSHDGYARLGVSHQREITVVPERGWRVLDTLSGDGEHVADSRLRLHPSLRWERTGDLWEARDASGATLLVVEPFGDPEQVVEVGLYAERFNQPQSVEVLRLSRRGAVPMVFGYWLRLPGGLDD